MRAFNVFKLVCDRFFYNPYKVVSKDRRISISSDTVLLKSCRFLINDDLNNSCLSIGSNSIVGCKFVFESEKGSVTVGDNSFINSGTDIISRESIDIGSNVTIAWGCTIYDHNSHPISSQGRRRDISQQYESLTRGLSLITGKDWSDVSSSPIKIESDAWIGFGCTILKGVTIGEGAIVGAKSVVRDDVPAWSVVAGNPAVIIKRLNQ